MKIKVNKEKLRAAIAAKLKEKEAQHKKDLAEFEKKKEQRDAELIAYFTAKIEQVKADTYESGIGPYDQMPFPMSVNSLSYGSSIRSLPYKPEINTREEKRLLAQLDIMEDLKIEIDDHSDYFRYI